MKQTERIFGQLSGASWAKSDGDIVESFPPYEVNNDGVGRDVKPGEFSGCYYL